MNTRFVIKTVEVEKLIIEIVVVDKVDGINKHKEIVYSWWGILVVKWQIAKMESEI